MSHERFAIYSTDQDKILCMKIWTTPNGHEQSSLLWAKVKESRYLILTSAGIDSLITNVKENSDITIDSSWVESHDTNAGKVSAFLLMNGWTTTSIIIPVKKVGISYTDELIEKGLDFVHGFKI